MPTLCLCPKSENDTRPRERTRMQQAALTRPLAVGDGPTARLGARDPDDNCSIEKRIRMQLHSNCRLAWTELYTRGETQTNYHNHKLEL